MPAFEFSFGRGGGPREQSQPMRLLVLGDFSGQAAAERPPLSSRPTRRVDVDNLDDVLQRLEPRLSLPTGEIRFHRMNHFHPDGSTLDWTCSRPCGTRAPTHPRKAMISSAACWGTRPSPVQLPPPRQRAASMH